MVFILLHVEGDCMRFRNLSEQFFFYFIYVNIYIVPPHSCKSFSPQL